MDTGFVWNTGKYERVRREHDVSFGEVVSAFEDEAGFEEPDPQGHEDFFMLLAATDKGRVLQIIYGDEYTEQGSLIFRIVTAFDAGPEWSDEYKRRL